MAIAIVDGALFRVGEHGVGFADFFELFFGVRIVGIAVRMILQRKLAVGTFQLLLGTSAADAEDLVVVAFIVLRRNGLSPQRLKPLLFGASYGATEVAPFPFVWLFTTYRISRSCFL